MHLPGLDVLDQGRTHQYPLVSGAVMLTAKESHVYGAGHTPGAASDEGSSGGIGRPRHWQT